MTFFKVSKSSETNQISITATIENYTLSIESQAKQYINQILAKLIRKLVMLHYDEIENLVTTILASEETKSYIQVAIRESVKEKAAKYAEDLFQE